MLTHLRSFSIYAHSLTLVRAAAYGLVLKGGVFKFHKTRVVFKNDLILMLSITK